jgi:hypothetical protein
MGQLWHRQQARSFLMASTQIACGVHISGHGSGVQILGCSDHGEESVPPDPMRTGCSRVAHGSCHAVGRRCCRELGCGSADRRHVGRVRLDSVSSIARPQASVVQCDVTGSVC